MINIRSIRGKTTFAFILLYQRIDKNLQFGKIKRVACRVDCFSDVPVYIISVFIIDSQYKQMGICNSKKDYELNPTKFNHNQTKWPNKKKIMTPTKPEKTKPAPNKPAPYVSQPETHQNMLPLTNKKLQSKTQSRSAKTYCSTYKVAQTTTTITTTNSNEQETQPLIKLKGNLLQSKKKGKPDSNKTQMNECSKTLHGKIKITQKQCPNRNERDNEDNKGLPSLIAIKNKLQSTEYKLNGQPHYQR